MLSWKLNKILAFSKFPLPRTTQKQPLEVLYKKVVLKNFAKFTVKHLFLQNTSEGPLHNVFPVDTEYKLGAYKTFISRPESHMNV